MDFEEVFKVLDITVFTKTQRRLKDVEKFVLWGAWQGQTYEEMATASDYRYTLSYLKQGVGPKLWKLLSEVLGEEVSKTNFQTALERQWRFPDTNTSLVGIQWRSSGAIHVQEVPLVADMPTQEAAQVLPNTSPALASIAEYLLPVSDPELPVGQVPLTSSLYVERPPIESRCYQEILQPGALIRIKAPRLMGKTSLMAKILSEARKHGYQTVPLSFQLADKAVFTNLDTFLRWFCESVGRKLQQLHQLDDYWSTYGSKDKSTAYFEECLLAEIDSPLVVSLDGVDRIFPYPDIADDFFSLLRAWYEYAKYGDSGSELWKKLRVVLVHSKEVYTPLDINQSPFNVGLNVELQEFSFQQVQDLVSRHAGLNWSNTQVEKLMDMVGGHPYLVKLALYHIQHQDITLEQLLQTAATEAGIYGDHLRLHLWNLKQHPELAAAFSRVVTTPIQVDLDLESAFKLHSMGLVVHRYENQVAVRCELYRRYFYNRLS